jgi:hypothetical protein
MVYKFDPIYFNGTTFRVDRTSRMVGDWMEFEIHNRPIPASCFPKSLVFDKASAALPDLFHTTRDIIVFSERARVVMEHWAPDQIEFIPVACRAEPKIAATLDFGSAYYFINVLGRAQRLQWLEMPTHKFQPLTTGLNVLVCYRTSARGSCVNATPENHSSGATRLGGTGTENTEVTVKFLSRTFFGGSLTQIFPIN